MYKPRIEELTFIQHFLEPASALTLHIDHLIQSLQGMIVMRVTNNLLPTLRNSSGGKGVLLIMIPRKQTQIKTDCFRKTGMSIITPFYRLKQGTKRWSHLLKATQLVCGTAGIQTQADRLSFHCEHKSTFIAHNQETASDQYSVSNCYWLFRLGRGVFRGKGVSQ